MVSSARGRGGWATAGRAFGALALVVAVASGLIQAPSLGVSKAAAAPQNSADLSTVELPGDLGQAGIQVYVKATRHTLRGYFLDYWRANGAASVYGNPISEPYASADGHYSQAFENGVFQFWPELVWTDSPSVLLQPIGETALSSRLDQFRRDGRRGSGGGDRRHAAWSPLPAGSAAIDRAVREGGIYVEATGHTVSGAFAEWYDSHEGWAYLGNPLSQPVAERGMVVQYFDGALLMRDDDGDVTLAPLAKELAPELGIDTTPAARGDLPLFRESLFVTRANPNPLGALDTPGRKWIEIDISEQRLNAYQGPTMVSSTLISTGLAPNDTELGLFHVRYKLETQDMAGTVGPDGAVIALGEDAANNASGNQSAYVVEDVPNVMYINADAEALHGAYWHNNFGNRMSHGCINLPLDMADFLFGWAPLGTMVWVHE